MIGITFVEKDGQESQGIYDDPNGLAVFETNDHYLVAGGLQEPIPVALYTENKFLTKSGSLQSCWPVNLGDIAPPIEAEGGQEV